MQSTLRATWLLVPDPFFKALSSLANGFGFRTVGFTARIVAEVHGIARERFPTLCAELILQADTTASEFKANQTLSNQKSVNGSERQLFNSRHVLNSIEPPRMIVGCSFGCGVSDRVAGQDCQAVLFKLAGLWIALSHVHIIDRPASCFELRPGCRSDPYVPNDLYNPEAVVFSPYFTREAVAVIPHLGFWEIC